MAVKGNENEWLAVKKELLSHPRSRFVLFQNLWGKDRFIRRSAGIDFEGDGQAPIQNWFSVPDMGALAADLYRRPLVILGENLKRCMTFLPYQTIRFNPDPIVLIFEGGNHWSLGKLKVNRLPRIDPRWIRHKDTVLALVHI